MNISEIKGLVFEVEEKTGCACSFEIRTFGSTYVTYIAGSVRGHVHHGAIEDAASRLKNYMVDSKSEIKQMLEDNKSRLADQLESVDDQLAALEKS